MKNLSFYILAITFLTSCIDKSATTASFHDEEYVFTVAPDIDHAVRDTAGNYFEMRCDYYGDQNYIVDDSGHVFYYTYKRSITWNCTPDTTKTLIPLPEFINLHPMQFLSLPDNSAEAISEANLPSKAAQNYVVIASAKDTFKSVPIYRILSLLDDNDIFIIRRMTAEEKIVLKHKKSGIPYNPKEVKWDPANINISTLPVQ